eukprot:g133.t1
MSADDVALKMSGSFDNETYVKAQSLLAKALEDVDVVNKAPRNGTEAAGGYRKSLSMPSMQTKCSVSTVARQKRKTLKVLKQGWIMKQGYRVNWIKGSRPWKRRWLTVWTNGKIEWRTDRDQQNPNNFILVTQYRVAEPHASPNSGIPGYDVEFALVHKDIERRDLMLRTKTMKEAESWSNALVASVGIPRFRDDTSGYRFICPLNCLKTDKDIIRVLKPKYRTHKKRGTSEALQIGEGSFAGVYRVTRLVDGVNLACKRVDVKPPDDRLSHLDEIQIMRRLDHPHIVRLLDCYVTTENKGGDIAYLFMEYCSGKTVIERLRKDPSGTFTNAQATKICRELLSALGYMHAKGYVHRDVKLENLIFRNAKPNSDVVLVDFGISRSFRDRRRMMTAHVGTPWYSAPEQMNGHYDEKCDVWAVGVCAFWMLAGHPPFGWKEAAALERRYGSTNDAKEQMSLDRRIHGAIRNAIINAKTAPPVVSQSGIRALPLASAFVQRLLQPDETRRPSAVEAIDLPWLHREMPKVHLPSRVKRAICELVRRDFFESAAMIIVAHTIERSKLAEAFKLYESIDTNGNGQISRGEWIDLLRANNVPNAVARRSFDLMDFDGNGHIRVSEFVAVTMDPKKVLTPYVVEAAFGVLDADGKGYITENDVARILSYADERVSPSPPSPRKTRRVSLDAFKTLMLSDEESSPRSCVHRSVISTPVARWRRAVSAQHIDTPEEKTPRRLLSQEMQKK